nr:MAG TPA: hypothetical protein [Caudoviricetes sp.]
MSHCLQIETSRMQETYCPVLKVSSGNTISVVRYYSVIKRGLKYLNSSVGLTSVRLFYI